MSVARNAPPPIELKDNVYRYGEQPRPRPVRYQGEKLPTLKVAPPAPPPEMKENPMSAEPFSFPTRPDRKPHWRDKLAPRRVVEADLPELLEWAIPRVQEIYPRATVESLMPMLRLGTQGGRYLFLRTESACGMYCAERTPWEPDLNVYGVFLVARRRDDDDLVQLRNDTASVESRFRTSLAAGLQPMSILDAAYKWAVDIGAVSFMFGSETKFDVTKFAERIGFDEETHGYVKKIIRE